MLGKIVIEGVEKIIYSPVQKTSSSGLFSNKRLALLSLTDASIGYLSKVPPDLLGFQDPNCMNKCKQIIRIKQIQKFAYKIQDKSSSLLRLSWLVGTKDKQWQFKFENQQIANEWVRYIALALEPPKPPPQVQQQKIDFTKIQSPKSRFADHYFPKQKDVPNNSEHQQVNQYSYSPKNNEKNLKQQSLTVQQQNNQNQQDGSTGRFYKFQQNNLVLHRQDTLPIITTFKQKFNNHEVLNVLSNNKSRNFNQTGNWNLKWFQEIQNKPKEVSLDTYKGFVDFCQQTCIQLVKEITKQKRTRTFIPLKINNLQEVYSIKETTFKLSVPFSTNLDESYLTHNEALLRQYQQEFQNNRFILKATYNKERIKVPLTCIIRYLGFIFFCQANAPYNYSQVQDQALYLFQKPLQKLEQRLSLSLTEAKVRLYTNKPSIPSENQTKNSYIIAYNLKYLIPRLKMAQNIYYFLPFQYYLSPQEKPKPIEGDKISKQVQQFSKKFLSVQQSLKCRIISVEDLQLSLRHFMLDKPLIYWMISKCKSKYLQSILATEIIADRLMMLVWINMSEFIKDQSTQYKPLTYFQDQIFKIICQLIVPRGQSWEIVTEWIFKRYQLTIRHQDIKIGYLLSSLSKKLGLQLDYQVLISQKQQYFSSRFMLPKNSVLSYSPMPLKYNDQDICFSYGLIKRLLFEQSPSEHSFKEVVAFYAIQSQKPNLSGYNWQALCRFMSCFIPINMEEGFQHLQIYQSLSLKYLDFQVFQNMVSAIKWLLLNNKKEDVLNIIDYFDEISIFWVGQRNPFSIVLQRLMGQYQNQQRNIQKSIEYCTKSVQAAENLFQGDGSDVENIDTDYKLANMFLISGKHMQALQKFKKVKKVIQKQNKQSLILLDLMVEIAKLYLHLSAIDKCLYYAKQAIKFGTLFPFKSQEQEFLVYELILKSLEILGDTQKMKFYIGLAQDKFAESQNHWVLRQVLKLTIIQFVLSSAPYYLKKFAFFLQLVQGKIGENQVNLSDKENFKVLKSQVGKGKSTQLLKQFIGNCPQIVDVLVMEQVQNGPNNTKRETYIKQGKKLKIFCDFIGYQYILGQIVSKLKQNDFF